MISNSKDRFTYLFPILAHYQTESAASNAKIPTQSPLTPDNALSTGADNVNGSPSRANAMSLTSSSSSSQSPSGTLIAHDPSADMSTETSTDLISSKPSNLLVTFLEYCSIVMQVCLKSAMLMGDF